MSKKTTKQSTFQSFYRSRFFIPVVISIAVCAAIVGIIIGSNSGDALHKTYVGLAVPKGWQLTAQEKTGGLACVLSDNPCPSQNYTFTLSSSQPAEGSINYLKSRLQQLGFVFDENCNASDCSNTYLQAHNTEVEVRASIQERNGDDALYLLLEKRL